MPILRRALSKPLDVIAYRTIQEARLTLLSRTAGWARLGRRARAWVTPDRIVALRRRLAATPTILAPDSLNAIREACAAQAIDRTGLLAAAERIAQRDFDVFGEPLPRTGPWPWDSDWRYCKTWTPHFFREYSFYETRDRPYDVKFPWELSRLGLLLPLIQATGLDAGARWLDVACDILADWDRRNPFAHSVNWVPMEASMRGISLALATEMLCLAAPEASKAGDRLLALLAGLLAAHGEFIRRTLEYTDVRGNHYAANLCALLLIGRVLGDDYPPARRWSRFAARAVPTEIRLQFLADGVNFEKSVAYHRLVAELFLLACVAQRRAGAPLPADCEQRLHAAACYALACRRPDGRAVDAGDNDGAQVLTFEPHVSTEHGPLIGVAATLFEDPALKAGAAHADTAVAWLTGRRGAALFRTMAAAPDHGARWFAAAGIAVVRSPRLFLWADFGEVGMAGRGGHGHNDTFSFELALDGVPLLVDPGSYVYTGDPAARDLFRGTAYHNAVSVDDAEMAPFLGFWRIEDTARPRNVRFAEQDGHVVVQGEHDGYARLPNPVTHRRRLSAAPGQGRLVCRDELRCSGAHVVRRHLHVAPGLGVQLDAAGVTLSNGAGAWRITWRDKGEATVETGWVSTGYRQRVPAPVLCLTNHIDGSADLEFTVSPLAEV